MDSSGLPSLLVQAAQSAAEADGVKASPAEAPSASADGAAAAADGVKSEGNEKDGGALNQILSAPAPVPKPKAKAPSPPAQAPSPSASSEPNKKRTTSRPLRRGKWTPEEEAYANRLIQEFKAGLLPLTDGTTLRTFLSKLLNCDPMRISKKFVGSNCIGKQVFRRRGADVNNMSPAEIEKTRFELSELEKKFLDRVAQNKSSGKGGGGGGSSRSSNKKSSKLSGGGNMPASAGGGLGGLNSNMNKSAAAVGRALLQGNKAPPQQGNGDGGGSSAGGLLAQLQAQQPGMFDNSTARSFLNAAGSQGSGSGLGNMNTNASITNLMLQTGMSRDQISQLASKGISSSASLANMLGKQRSFDQLMSLDFQSMQSIDNLANLIQAGMPGQASRLPKAAMKNMDWGTQGSQTNALGSSGASGLLARSGGSMQGSIENLVRTLSSSSAGGLNSNQGVNNSLANANFGNFLQNATQQNNNLGGGGGGSNDLNNILQTLQQQQHQQQQQQQQQQNQGNNNLNYGNLLQNMAQGNNAGSLFQTNSNNTFGSNLGQNNPAGGANDLMNMLSQSQNAGNSGHQNNVNPLLQQLNNPFGGLQNAGSGNDTNPLMAAMAQQQLLAQASGGNNNMANLLGQQNGLAGLGMNFNNNALGNLGALGGNLGGNLGNLGGLGGVNLGGSNNNQNTAALFQQLLQQNQSIGANNSNQGNAQVAQGGGSDNTSGNKRSIDEVNGGDNDGPNKKTVAL